MNEPTSLSVVPSRLAGGLTTRVAILGAALLTVAASFTAVSGSAEAATPYWAKISATGAGIAGNGVTSVVHIGTGRYQLTFSHNISACAVIGTINTNGGNDPGPGSGSILVGQINATQLFVRTATPSSTGSATVDDDRPFSVTLSCP